jgi:hypothetical protein
VITLHALDGFDLGGVNAPVRIALAVRAKDAAFGDEPSISV